MATLEERRAIEDLNYKLVTIRKERERVRTLEGLLTKIHLQRRVKLGLGSRLIALFTGSYESFTGSYESAWRKEVELNEQEQRELDDWIKDRIYRLNLHADTLEMGLAKAAVQ